MPLDRLRLIDELAAIVTDADRVTELPQRVCDTVVDLLPIDGVGLSLMNSGIAGGRTLLGASNDVGAEIEELQYRLGEGPCVSAFHDNQPVLVPDLQSAEATVRWPMFTREIAPMGVRAIFAMPLRVGTASLGVLDFHRVHPGPLLEVIEALLVADAVAVVLFNYQLRQQQTDTLPDLYELSRLQHELVHLAIGMVSGQLDIPNEQAIDLLRAYAYEHGERLNDVAEQVVERRLRLTLDT
ncbi:GAF and ANTAR domain-containing protein [Actinopolymorpha sp. NPDC004070]|uniref:GAF and ANTAR domain-containing protein n=1 Tax=Actinopolymorpha sp. NPDC004070 TaxID=3154548 RepID=UPI0033A236C8